MRILISEPEDFPEEGIRILAEAGEVECRPVSTAELKAAFRSYDAILVRLAHWISPETIGTTPRCRVLGVPTTGLDHVDLDACCARGIRVVSLRGETEFLRTIRATAEHSIGLALALLRHIVPANRAVADGGWDRDEFRGYEISGTAVGILGMGRIGLMVADMYRCIGAVVLGYDRRTDWSREGVVRCADLRSLCEQSRLLSIHVSYDAGDPPVLDREAIANLPFGAFLVNTSRGGVIDEHALLDALESGHLAGAALDVVRGEPDVSCNPLIEYAKRRPHANLIITPHVGGNTYESRGRAETLIARRVADELARLG